MQSNDMESNILISLLLNIISRLMEYTAKKGWRSLFPQEPIIDNAIEDTKNTFGNIENLAEILDNWFKSDSFPHFLNDVKVGKINIDEKIMRSFIEITGFFCGNDTEKIAFEILHTLFRNIEHNLLITNQGLPIIEQRSQIRHKEMTEKIDKIDKNMIPLLREIHKGIDRLPYFLQKAEPSAMEIDDDVANKSLHAKIDLLKNLISKGKFLSSKKELEAIRKGLVGKETSSAIQLRIAINVGVCALNLNDISKAKLEFEEALHLAPNDVKALTNAAHIALFENDLELGLEYTDKALSIDPHFSGAMTLHLMILYKKEGIKGVESILAKETWILKDEDCLGALGQIFYFEGDYERSRSYLQSLLELNNSNPGAHLLLGEVMLEAIRFEYRNNIPFEWEISGEFLKRLNLIAEEFTIAVRMFEEYEDKNRLNMALINRASTYSISNNVDKAMADCDRILQQSSDYDPALALKGDLLFRKRQYADATVLFELINDPIIKSKTFIQLGLSYLNSNKPNDAISLLIDKFEKESDKEKRADIGDVLVRSYEKIGNRRMATEIISKIGAINTLDPYGALIVAQFHIRNNNIDGAISILRHALSNVKGRLKKLIIIELADALQEKNNFLEAAQLYEKIVDLSNNNPILVKYLVSLYNSGQHAKALKIAQSLRANGKALPKVSNIESLILQGIGQLDTAIQLEEELSELEPTDVNHRIRIALLHLRRAEHDLARKALQNIRDDEIKDNPEALISIAEARAILKEDNVLPLAYNARGQDFHNPDIHLSYISLVIQRQHIDKNILEMNEIKADAAVLLKINDEIKTYILVTDRPISRNEILLDDELAQRIIGKKRGDTILIKDTPFEKIWCTIEDIQSKYVYAFNETFREFTTLFPSHPGMHKISFKDKDYSNLFAPIDERHRFVKMAQLFYMWRQLTIGAFANLLGSSSIEVWAGLIQDENVGLSAFDGNHQTTQFEIRKLNEDRAMVLDVLSILTLVYLDIELLVRQNHQRLFVNQSVLDLFNQAIANQSLREHGIMTIYKDKDRYFKEEISPEAVLQGTEFLEKAREFITKQTTVVSRMLTDSLDQSGYENFSKLIGVDSLDTALSCKERGAILYSDDLFFRHFSSITWNIDGISTQSVLLDLRYKNKIDDNMFRDAKTRLAMANYKFLHISAEDIYYFVSSANFTISKEASKLLSIAEGPYCDEGAAINILGELIYRVWIENIDRKAKYMICDIALSTLIKGRPIYRVIPKFKTTLKERFRFLPLHLTDLFENIDRWVEVLEKTH